MKATKVDLTAEIRVHIDRDTLDSLARIAETAQSLADQINAFSGKVDIVPVLGEAVNES